MSAATEWTLDQREAFLAIADAESYQETVHILTGPDASPLPLDVRADRAAAALAAHVVRTEEVRLSLEGPADYEGALGKFTSLLDLLTAQPLSVADVVELPEPLTAEDAAAEAMPDDDGGAPTVYTPISELLKTDQESTSFLDQISRDP